MKQASGSEQEINPAEESDPAGNGLPPSDRVAFREISPGIGVYVLGGRRSHSDAATGERPPSDRRPSGHSGCSVGNGCGGALGLRLYNWRTRI
ncbi:MAG: hypothetical protein AAF662_04450 [Pseudomonadota bacterium]